MAKSYQFTTPDDPVVKQFAAAFSHFDTEGIRQLLAPRGEFIIQGDDEEDLLVEDSREFVAWLDRRFKELKEDDPVKKKIRYEFDVCQGCSARCPVVYFEGAIFPRRSDDPEEILLHGLMIDVKDGKISRVLICYNFQYLEKYA